MDLNPVLKGQWGFHPLQDAYYNSEKDKHNFLFPARVTFVSRDHHRVLLFGHNQEQYAKVRGRLASEKLAVGDWVKVELLPGDHQFLPINSILPRISALRRQDASGEEQVLLSNVNSVCLMTSFNRDFNPRRIERGISMISDSQAQPIVVINKLDLMTPKSAAEMIDDLRERINGVEIFACSVRTGVGIHELIAKFQPGETVAFLGMSGVGKSSIINQILKSEVLATSQVRTDDDRGRHTTTHRELFQSQFGFWLIDSPGIREFSIAGDEESLVSSFDDVKKIMSSCRFGNCSHLTEPDCGIKIALASGVLNEDRWRNYLKMKRELEHHLHRKDKAFQSEKRKERIRLSKSLRQKLKHRERR